MKYSQQARIELEILDVDLARSPLCLAPISSPPGPTRFDPEVPCVDIAYNTATVNFRTGAAGGPTQAWAAAIAALAKRLLGEGWLIAPAYRSQPDSPNRTPRNLTLSQFLRPHGSFAMSRPSSLHVACASCHSAGLYQAIPSFFCISSKVTPLVSGYTKRTTKNCSAIMNAKNTKG